MLPDLIDVLGYKVFLEIHKGSRLVGRRYTMQSDNKMEAMSQSLSPTKSEVATLSSCNHVQPRHTPDPSNQVMCRQSGMGMEDKKNVACLRQAEQLVEETIECRLAESQTK